MIHICIYNYKTSLKADEKDGDGETGKNNGGRFGHFNDNGKGADHSNDHLRWSFEGPSQTPRFSDSLDSQSG